jgi:hypothetical protein
MTKHEAILAENAKLRNALRNLRDGMRANDDYLDDDDKAGGATAPDGDNYNDLFDLVQDALKAAGIPYREGV